MIKTRLINAVFAVAIITGVVVMLGFILPRLSKLTSGPSRIASTPVILQQVQTLSQLVTVKYVMEKVVDLPDMQWYKDMIGGLGDSRVLLVAHGIVKAGVDLSELKPGDIEVNGKKISIKLPPARVTDTYIDDKHTQVVERTTGLLRSFDKDLEQNARRQAVLDINRAAREAGIEKDAADRAKEQLKGLFHQLGFEEVEFRSP
jgi:hypothetical protein